MEVFKYKSKCIEALLRFVVNTYFIQLNSIMIVYNASSLTPLKLDYLEGLKTVLGQSTNEQPFVLHWVNLNNAGDSREIILKNVELGCQGYITLIDNASDFISAKYYATEKSIARLKDLKMLFLSEKESVGEVLGHKNLKIYPSHVFVHQNKNGDFELWTQKFIGLTNNEKPVLLNIYYSNETFSTNKTLYPNKFVDLERKSLRIAAVTYIPYVISENVEPGSGNADSIDAENGSKNIFYDGSEAHILLEFCKLRNCTPKIIPYGTDQWGGIYENGSSDGMIGSVYRKETEFGIGCYYNWYNEEFETSIAIAKSSVTLLAPAPSRYPPYLTAILPFTPTVWNFILGSMIVCSLILYGIKYYAHAFPRKQNRQRFCHGESYMLALLQVASIFFQQSCPETKGGQFANRFFLGSLLLAGVTLENAYSGELKSILTVPLFMSPIDTALKFANSEIKWGAPALAWVLSISESNISFEQTLNQNFEIRNYEDFRNLSFSKVYGFGIERLHSGSYSFGAYIQEDALSYLIVLKDNIYFEYTRGFSVRGWPLMESFNTFCLWVLEHGLYHNWERKMVAKYLDSTTEQGLLLLGTSHKEKPLPTVLNISHVSGHLCVLVIGYTMSTGIFILELITFKLKTFLQNRINQHAPNSIYLR